MRAKLLLLALLFPLLGGTAEAGWWWDGVRGNDIGGIIPWSSDVALVYRDIAAVHCARWNKVAIITSVHKVYGDYVGFRCFFPPGYDPRKDMVYGAVVRARY